MTVSKTPIATSRAEDEPLESTPLLGSKTLRKVHSPLAVAIIVLVIIIFLQGGDELFDSPATRIIESVSCYRYYQQHDPSQLLTDPDGAGPGALRGVLESSCKVNAVQAEVAKIRTYQISLESIPSLVLAVPFGWLHDRYGRRPFFIIGALSFALRMTWIMAVLWFWQSFDDMRWTWLSSLHALMMGGNPVVGSLYYTIIADISTEQVRATNFLRLGACSLSTMLVVPLATAWMMSLNPWLPAFLGLFFTLLAFLLAFFLPETLNYLHSDEINLTTPEPVRESVSGLWQGIKQTTRFLWQDSRIPMLIVPFTTHLLAMAMTQILVQFASKRYDYTVAAATVLVTVRAGIIVLVLFSILPLISKLLISKLGFSPKYKDLILTRVSLLIMAIGSVLIGISPTSWFFVISLIITSLGSGAMFTLRSFLTSLVPAHQIARTYSVVCVVDTLGLMFGAPLMAQAFERGMVLGGLNIGLPFYLFGAMSFGFALLLMFVNLRKDEHPIDSDE